MNYREEEEEEEDVYVLITSGSKYSAIEILNFLRSLSVSSITVPCLHRNAMNKKLHSLE